MAVHPGICRLLAFEKEIAETVWPVSCQIVDHCIAKGVLNDDERRQLTALSQRQCMKQLIATLKGKTEECEQQESVAFETLCSAVKIHVASSSMTYCASCGIERAPSFVSSCNSKIIKM